MQAVETLTAHPAAHPAIHAAAPTMHAILHRAYGEPDVLAYGEIPRPIPGDEEIVVRVHAAGASIGDHHVVTGRPYLVRLSSFGGFPAPRNPVPGAAMAGVVDAVGAKVTAFRPGDEVFGQALSGAFAEYLALPAKLVAKKPKNLSFEQAAAVPWGTTALQGLRDAGGLTAGQRVLINGASGAVGTWAVQIAKALGAHVTAVCSTKNVELVRGLGADEVVDYTRDDFVSGGARFDVVMDMVGNRALSELKSVLVPGGRYVPCAGGGGDYIGPFVRILAGFAVFLFGGRTQKLFVQSLAQKDLEVMTELVESGKCKPVVDRTYPLREVGAALRHVGEGHARGVTVIRVVE
jgi:NADPH:quinone reductase-like Zn-dependent oxidoreductase